jgi:hypothetical protein
MTFGVDFPLLGRVLRANDFARYTYAVTFFSFFFILRSLLFWVYFVRGGNGYHFQGSRGGNDTRLHCLGTVEYVWVAIFIASCHLLRLLFFLLFLFLTDCFLCTSDSGIGEQRASLPLVCGWLGWVASETMGCGVVSV